MSDYPNSGIISANDKKETDRHPDIKGKGDITCPHCNKEHGFWISGWRKTGRYGIFHSLSFESKEGTGAANPGKPSKKADTQQPEQRETFDDDIPF